MNEQEHLEVRDLTAEEEDYLLETAREQYFEDKEREQEQQSSLCQFCMKEKGELPIYDGETIREILICKSCMKSLLNTYIKEELENKTTCCLNTELKR